jgi:hypothetical protein
MFDGNREARIGWLNAEVDIVNKLFLNDFQCRRL